jgi:hypothetical protein
MLIKWRGESLFNQDEDFLFPSNCLNGKKLLTPDVILKDYLRPAVVRAGITGKIIGCTRLGIVSRPMLEQWGRI